MAQFTRTNGDFYPVVNFDYPAYTNAGVNAIDSGYVVQPHGPKLDFMTISAASTTHFSPTQANVIIETIQQLATIYIYEYTNTTTDTFAFATYPTGAWSVDGSAGSNVVLAINNALTAASVANTTTGTNSATFTTVYGA
jgi:hypothetical protein